MKTELMQNVIQNGPGEVGMTFQEELPFEEWREIGQRFGEATKRFSWALGDWLVYGGSKYKKRISAEMYRDAEDATGVDKASLLALATVCRRIPLDKRILHLSFEHHQAVASIANEESRFEWLQFLAGKQSQPSKKILKLSISCSPKEPKLITKEELENRKRKFGRDNYVVHLTRLLSVLRKTLPIMDDDEVEALRADTKGLRRLLDAL
jgi:hypothetical protein